MNETLQHYMVDGLSLYDLEHMNEIIRENMGDWYHAQLLRCLHILLPKADWKNRARLEAAYPGSCAAYIDWYQGNLKMKRGEKDGSS